MFTMPALALLAGALLGWAARRRGFPGPVLIRMAYLIAGPGDGGLRYQVIPYWAAMAVAGAGVLGAVIAAVIRRDTEAVETSGEQTGLPAAPQADPPLPPAPRRLA